MYNLIRLEIAASQTWPKCSPVISFITALRFTSWMLGYVQDHPHGAIPAKLGAMRKNIRRSTCRLADPTGGIRVSSLTKTSIPSKNAAQT